MQAEREAGDPHIIVTGCVLSSFVLAMCNDSTMSSNIYVGTRFILRWNHVRDPLRKRPLKRIGRIGKGGQKQGNNTPGKTCNETNADHCTVTAHRKIKINIKTEIQAKMKTELSSAQGCAISTSVIKICMLTRGKICIHRRVADTFSCWLVFQLEGLIIKTELWQLS